MVLHKGAFIGRVGAWIADGKASLWFSFMPSAQGKGYAMEAMWPFIRLLGPVGLEMECDPRNVGSWRLAQRLGFLRESLTENAMEIKGEWVGSLVYRKAAWGNSQAVGDVERAHDGEGTALEQ